MRITHLLSCLAAVAILLAADEVALGGDCPGDGDCHVANGSPGCAVGDCCEAVCAVDPFCCDVSWDGICANEASSICPVNDLCGSPTPIFEGNTAFSTIGANTDGASHAFCDFCCDDEQIGSDIWFLYSATVNGDLIVNTCGSSYDTKLAVYTNAAEIGYICQGGPPQALLGCDDDAGCGLTSEVTVSIVAGKQYRIRIGGFQGAQGTGTVNLTVVQTGTCLGDLNGDTVVDGADLGAMLASWGPCDACPPADLNNDSVVDGVDLGLLLGAWGPCPAGDFCANAIDLPQQTFVTADGTTADNSTNTSDVSSCALNDFIDEWYVYYPYCDATVYVSTCNPGTDYDTTLAAYVSCTAPIESQEIVCNDDVSAPECQLPNGLNRKSKISFPVTSGMGPVYIRVSGYNGNAGNFEMTVFTDCIG